MRRQEDGFTLIELVIVLVILGILAAVAVPQFVDTKASAQSAAVGGGRASTGSGIATYTARNSTAPTGTQLASEISAKSCSAGFIQIGSTGTEGVKIAVAKAGPVTSTACTDVIVGLAATGSKYTTAL